MRTASSFIAAVMTIGLVACSDSAAPRPFGEPETQAINQLIGEFIATYNAKDAAKLSRLFTEGGAVLPPNASTMRGSENIREHYVRRFAQGASDLTLQAQTVAGSGNLAFASGDYRLVMKPAEGTARRDRGKFLFVLRAFDGKWLLDQLMFSSDFGPEGGPVVG